MEEGMHCPLWAKTLSPPSSCSVDSAPVGSYGVKHEIESLEECPNGISGVNRQQSWGTSSFQKEDRVLLVFASSCRSLCNMRQYIDGGCQLTEEEIMGYAESRLLLLP